MKKQVMLMACVAVLLSASILRAQASIDSEVAPEETVQKGDIVKRFILKEKQPLPYPPLREADILWETNLIRVVDVREKMNLPFVYPEAPLFNLFADAVKKGSLPSYSVENDDFTVSLNTQEVQAMMVSRDTIVVVNPVTYDEEVRVVENVMNWEDVKRFRIKEKWYFDANTSTMKVRILGIAPLREVYDDLGNFRFETPMFWINYAEARPILAHQRVFNMGGNQSSKTTWEDLFEMRYFSSYVVKNQNVYDRRLQDYLSGTDALVEGQRIEDEIFNYEQDFWAR